MLAITVRQNKFLLGYADMLVSEIADSRFTEQPVPGVNHPAWIIGHLAYTGDNCVGMLGGDKTMSQDWVEKFKGGTSLTSNREDYPSKAELMAALHERFTTAQALAERITPEQAAAPSPHPRSKDKLPQLQDLVAFVMNGHFGVHLGQLSTWRRMIGMPPLF